MSHEAPVTTPISHISDEDVPNLPVGFMTAARLEVAGWMQRYAPSTAELYVGALHLLFGPPIPGRVTLICHAVREICNRLPGRISGEESDARIDYPTRLDGIATSWARAALEFEPAIPLGGQNSRAASSAEIVTMPTYVFVSIASLVRDHVNGRSKPEQTARRLFNSAAPEGSTIPAPVIAQWLETRKWFVGRAHDTGRLDTDIDPDELGLKFELFERSLFAIARGFYPTLDDVDAILADANS